MPPQRQRILSGHSQLDMMCYHENDRDLNSTTFAESTERITEMPNTNTWNHELTRGGSVYLSLSRPELAS